MPLFDNPPHRIKLQSVASSVDSGGGSSSAYTDEQTGIPASINTASAAERELFAQMGMVLTHTIAVLTSALDAVPERGWKVVTEDRSESFHVLGIRHGRAYGSVPSFVYLQCESQL